LPILFVVEEIIKFFLRRRMKTLPLHPQSAATRHNINQLERLIATPKGL